MRNVTQNFELAAALRKLATEIEDCPDQCSTQTHMALLYAELELVAIRHEEADKNG